MICIAEYTAAATALTAVAGWMTPESVRTYVSINADPWDNNVQFNFEEPMGSLGIEFDVINMQDCLLNIFHHQCNVTITQVSIMLVSNFSHQSVMLLFTLGSALTILILIVKIGSLDHWHH